MSRCATSFFRHSFTRYLADVSNSCIKGQRCCEILPSAVRKGPPELEYTSGRISSFGLTFRPMLSPGHAAWHCFQMGALRIRAIARASALMTLAVSRNRQRIGFRAWPRTLNPSALSFHMSGVRPPRENLDQTANLPRPDRWKLATEMIRVAIALNYRRGKGGRRDEKVKTAGSKLRTRNHRLSGSRGTP